MQIQNINNTNFQGGYKFIRMPKAARAELETLIPKGKTIYDSFEGKKRNVFLVTRNRYHNLVANFIKTHNLNYRYYPEIKAKMNFKLGHPEKVSELIKGQTPKKIDFDNADYSRLIEHRARQSFARNYGDECVNNILKTLKISMDDTSLISKYGAKAFKNTDHTKSVLVSAPSKDRIFYVKVSSLISTTEQKPVERYAMSPEGAILRDYTYDYDNWELFNKKFNETLDR